LIPLGRHNTQHLARRLDILCGTDLILQENQHESGKNRREKEEEKKRSQGTNILSRL